MATDRTTLSVLLLGRDEASRPINRVQSSIIRLVGAVASLTAAFRTIAFPINEAIDFETALISVQKTTGFTDESIKQLSYSLRELAQRTGVTATALAQIAAAAGQLGLGSQGQQAIVAFTDTVSRFSVVADLAVDEAATSIAKITNLFKLPIDQAEKVSAAFNELSNTTVATADQLIDISRRVGSAGGLLKFADAAALAAASLELGQTPEVAGTAISKAFANAQVQAEDFARTVGVTTDQWTTQLETDGLGALKDVFKAISQLDGVARANAIRELFGGGRQFAFASRFVEDAANGFRILGRTTQVAATAYEQGTSAIKEFENVQRSTQQQIERTKRSFEELAIAAGQRVLPAVNRVAKALQEFAQDPTTVNRVEALAENLLAFAEAAVKAGQTIQEILPPLEVFLYLLGSLALFLAGRSLAALTVGLISPFAKAGKYITATVGALETAILTASYMPSVFGGAGRALVSFVQVMGEFFAVILTGFGPAGLVFKVVAGIAIVGTALYAGYKVVKSAIVAGYEATNKAGQELITNQREQLRQIEANIAAFQEAINANNGQGLAATTIDDQSKNVGDLEAQFQQAVNVLTKIRAGIAGSADQQRTLVALSARYNEELVGIDKRLTELKKEYESQQKLAGKLFDGSTRKKNLDEEIQQLTKHRANLENLVDSMSTRYDEIRAQTRNLISENNKGLDSLASRLTTVQLDALESTLRLREASKQLADNQNELRKVTTDVLSGQNVDQSREQAAKQAELEANISRLTADVEKYNAALKDNGTSLDAAFGPIALNAVKNLDTEVGINLIAGLRKAKNEGTGLQQSIENIVKAVRNQTVALVEAERSGQVFDRLKEAATSVAKAIGSVFDNLPKQIRAARQDLSEFLGTLQSIPAERTATLKIDTDTKKANESLDRDIARIEKIFKRRIDRAQSISDEGVRDKVIARLEKQKKAQIDALDARKKDNETIADATKLEASYNSQLAKLNALSSDAKKLEAQLADAQKEKGEAALAKQTALLQQTRLLNDQIKDQQKAVFSAGEEYAKFGGRVSDSTAALNGLKDGFVVKDSDIQKVSTDTADAVQKSIEATSGLLVQANESADRLQASITNLDGFTQTAVRAREEIARLNQFLGLSDQSLQSMKDSVTEMVDKFSNGLVPSAEKIASFLATPIDNVNLGLPDEQTRKGIVTDLIKQIDQQPFSDAVKEQIQKGINDAEIGGVLLQEYQNTDLPPKTAPIEFKATNRVEDLVPDDIEVRVKFLAAGNTAQLADALGITIGGQKDGGLIRGPGTGTSDSILSRLSNGEFVIDAFTTSKFGASFFTALQRIARTGLPRFATGGLVGSSALVSRPLRSAQSALTGFSQGEVHTVRILIPGSEPIELRGDRETVRRFNEAVGNTNRGKVRGDA